MIVLTFTSSTASPTLPRNKDNFEPGPRRNRHLLAVTLMTKMLWFLYPECFPWDDDNGMILRIPEMMKSMGEIAFLDCPIISYLQPVQSTEESLIVYSVNLVGLLACQSTGIGKTHGTMNWIFAQMNIFYSFERNCCH